MQTSVNMNQATALRRSVTPFKAFSKRVPVIRAAGEESTPAPAASSSTPIVQKSIPTLTWQKDNETIKEVFAFAGPLPERLNGRMAMLGFAGIALAEMSKHTPALEQFGDNWFVVILYSLIFTVASCAPKFVSSSSLKSLNEAATQENLKGGEGAAAALAFFDANTELWTGRIAMLGLVGLAAFETVKGDAFF